MPIYEYICKGCNHHFETLVRGSEEPRCPECESTDLEKQFSVFGVASGSPGCEPVGGG